MNLDHYRKKPVVIAAFQWRGDNWHDVVSFLCREGAEEGIVRLHGPDQLRIKTLESGQNAHIADKGDWIIRGVAGEFYACKPGIFEATYEPASVARPEAGAIAKDAERYRFLRDRADPDDGHPAIRTHDQNSWGKWYYTYDTGEAADRKVDAAIAASSKPQVQR